MPTDMNVKALLQKQMQLRMRSATVDPHLTAARRFGDRLFEKVDAAIENLNDDSVHARQIARQQLFVRLVASMLRQGWDDEELAELIADTGGGDELPE